MKPTTRKPKASSSTVTITITRTPSTTSTSLTSMTGTQTKASTVSSTATTITIPAQHALDSFGEHQSLVDPVNMKRTTRPPATTTTLLQRTSTSPIATPNVSDTNIDARSVSTTPVANTTEPSYSTRGRGEERQRQSPVVVVGVEPENVTVTDAEDGSNSGDEFRKESANSPSGGNGNLTEDGSSDSNLVEKNGSTDYRVVGPVHMRNWHHHYRSDGSEKKPHASGNSQFEITDGALEESSNTTQQPTRHASSSPASTTTQESIAERNSSHAETMETSGEHQSRTKPVHMPDTRHGLQTERSSLKGTLEPSLERPSSTSGPIATSAPVENQSKVAKVDGSSGWNPAQAAENGSAGFRADVLPGDQDSVPPAGLSDSGRQHVHENKSKQDELGASAAVSHSDLRSTSPSSSSTSASKPTTTSTTIALGTEPLRQPEMSLPEDFARVERGKTWDTSPYVSQKKLDRLWRYLFGAYYKESPPVPQDGGPLPVGVGINFVKFKDFDEVAGTMNIALNLRLCWDDDRLSFNAQEFFNMSWSHEGDKIPIRSNFIWTPDITVLNEVGGLHKLLATHSSPLVLSDDAFRNETGVNVLWSRPLDVRSNCDVDMSQYPFDEQRCYIVIGSWASSRRQMELVPQPFFAEYTVHTSEFRVHNITVRKRDIYTRNTAEKFNEVVYSIVLQRYPHYYVINFILPMVAITLLTVATMWMSPGNVGPRVNSGTKLLLCVVSIIFITARNRPAIHGDIWMDRFQSHCLALSMSSVLESLFIDYLSKTTLTIAWAPRADTVDATLRSMIAWQATYIIFTDATEVKRYSSLSLYTSFQAGSTGLLVAFVYLIFFGLILSSAINMIWMITPRTWQRKLLGKEETPTPLEIPLTEVLGKKVGPGNGFRGFRGVVGLPVGTSSSDVDYSDIGGISGSRFKTPDRIGENSKSPRGNDPRHRVSAPSLNNWLQSQYSTCPTSDEDFSPL